MIRRCKLSLWLLSLPLILLSTAFTWPWDKDGPWPGGSEHEVTALDFASFENLIQVAPEQSFKFAVFGDQRALADGEWQEILAGIERISAQDPELRFVIDTGDMVYAGEDSDQWRYLRNIIRPLAHLPYLVAVGNHELGNNRSPEARRNSAAFLSYLDPDLGVDRMYYRKEFGRLTFLFLDSNDMVYGEQGEGGAASPLPQSRTERQMKWLVEELTSVDESRTLIVVIHHPLVQSSRKHRQAAARLWSYSWRGRRLPDILADGGVDLILTGHTHTYESFHLSRDDGREMSLINLSGRPRDSFLWFGSKGRRARDMRGEELAALVELGWHDLEGWSIEQTDAMLDRQANNFGVFEVDPAGGITLTMHFLDEDGQDGFRRQAPRQLHPAR